VLCVGCFRDLLLQLAISCMGCGICHASLASVSITDIPLGYGIFCSAFDFVVAAYLMISNAAWHKPYKFDPYFWRHIARADEVIE
jgi:hypothetical protein